MKRTTAALVGLLWLAAPPAPAGAEAPAPSEPRWRPFQSTTGRFQVLAPSRPERLLDSTWTLAGPIHEVAYHFDWQGARFGVTYHDLPAIAQLLFSDGSLMNRAVAELLDVMGGRLIEEREVTLQGHRGRAVTYAVRDEPGVIEEARFFLVGQRLYLLEAATHRGEGTAPSAPALRFLDSFRVLESDGDPTH